MLTREAAGCGKGRICIFGNSAGREGEGHRSQGAQASGSDKGFALKIFSQCRLREETSEGPSGMHSSHKILVILVVLLASLPGGVPLGGTSHNRGAGAGKRGRSGYIPDRLAEPFRNIKRNRVPIHHRHVMHGRSKRLLQTLIIWPSARQLRASPSAGCAQASPKKSSHQSNSLLHAGRQRAISHDCFERFAGQAS